MSASAGGSMASKRPSISNKLSALVQVIKRAFSPAAQYPYTPGNDDVAPSTGLLDDIKSMGFKDYETLLQFLNAAVTGVIDDDKLLLEHLIQLLSKLPPHSKEGKQLTDGFITQLWGTLDHPPVSSLGGEYKYRAPDGSNNNIHVPNLGAANTPYARTTPPMVYQSPNQPDPGLIFDLLMERGPKFEPHPNRISSVLFYMATIIIHDIFQTVSLLVPFLVNPVLTN
jgi:hypothetical protein